jgi:hypothetical protein
MTKNGHTDSCSDLRTEILISTLNEIVDQLLNLEFLSEFKLEFAVPTFSMATHWLHEITRTI